MSVLRFKCLARGGVVTADKGCLLGTGGQAEVYGVAEDPALAIKIYHKTTPELLAKLRLMIHHPPRDPMAAKGHASIAWPLDLLAPVGEPGAPAGFLMPRVHRVRSIGDFFNPKSRRENCPGFNYLYLHRTARNLATAIHALHARGYVIGDVNESNILVSDTALVTLVDVDSFQVTDPGRGVVYRCPVGRPDTTPPELLARLRAGSAFADLDRLPEQDAFGLAVLIFQLLMEGTHPFAGVYDAEGEPPTYADRIVAGHFPHSPRPGIPYRPVPSAPPFSNLAQPLRDLFSQCFEAGHERPAARPVALAWRDALDQTARSLVVCQRNQQHLYFRHVPACPWCERTRQLAGRDPFPFIAGVTAPVVGPSGELAAIKLPERRVETVQPPPPGTPLKLKLASRKPAFAPRPKRAWFSRLLALPGFNRLPEVWTELAATGTGRHLEKFWRGYVTWLLLASAITWQWLFPRRALACGLALLLVALWWKSRPSLRGRRWHALALTAAGLILALKGLPRSPWPQLWRALERLWS